MNVDFPLRFDGRGRTAETDDENHIRDLIEQVLFTSPGERVNRPNFGCGIARLVFSPNSTELAAATQFLVQGSLQQWLGSMIQVNDVQVETDEAQLLITIKYTLNRTQQQQKAVFTRGGIVQ